LLKKPSLPPILKLTVLRKKFIEKIVDRVRNSLIGSTYSMSDFVYKVKELCLRENVAFDNDLLDEFLDRKNQ
jgi:hypothetical protein